MNPPRSIVTESGRDDRAAKKREKEERRKKEEEKSTGLKTRHYKTEERTASEGRPY
jgi:hypothetical protein